MHPRFPQTVSISTAQFCGQTRCAVQAQETATHPRNKAVLLTAGASRGRARTAVFASKTEELEAGHTERFYMGQLTHGILKKPRHIPQDYLYRASPFYIRDANQLEIVCLPQNR